MLREPTFPLTRGVGFFLPLLHIAWSDEILTPSEIHIIEQKIRDQQWLSPEEKGWLCDRLDPSHPPTARELKHWLKHIRETGQGLPADAKDTLVALSIRLADLGTEDKPGIYKSQSATAALTEIEEALGIVGWEAAQEMLSDATTPSEHLAEPPISQPSFSAKSLQKVLDGKQAKVKDQVRTLLSDPVFSYDRISPVKEEYREVVLEWCRFLADQGYGALSYPKAVGGGGDMATYLAVVEMLGYHELSLFVKFGVQFGLFGGSIVGLGTEPHYQEYLPATGKLELAGCFAMTEANHGSNVREIETTAVYDPNTQEFVIHTPHYFAHKEYIGNAAAHGRVATVFAQLETLGERYGVHAFVVPIRDEAGNPLPGVKIEDCGEKMGLQGVDNGRLWFDQVRIPRTHLLNRFGDVSESGAYTSPITSESRRFFTMLGTLVGGRVAVPMAGLSAAKSGLAIAIKYAAQRRQFGAAGQAETRLLDYRTHQRRLLPLVAKAYAMHFSLAWMKELYMDHLKTEAEDSRELEALAAGLKAVSTWNTTEILQECREACGGNGYLAVNRLGTLKADSEIFTTFEGDNTVLMQLVAKARITEFKHSFSSMNFFGLLNYLGSQAATALAEKNPITIRNTSEEHLLDTDFQLSAFRYRENHLVSSAARRLKHRIDQGMDSYQAFIEVQTHLVAMAHAYIDRIVLERMVEAVQKVKGKKVQRVLHQLRSLYALHQIETDKGWFLKEGYLSSNKASAIRKLVDKLCLELRDDAVELVDAFGIPDALLGAPIAVKYNSEKGWNLGEE